MKTLRKISALLIILTATLAFGQVANKDSVRIFSSFKCSVSGKVLDMSSNPISDVKIEIKGTTWKAITDSSGYYQINSIRKGIYTLCATSKDGMYDEKLNFQVFKDSTVVQNFILIKRFRSDNIEDIPEIEIQIPKEHKVVKDVTAKPIIYLYPETEKEVNVKLNYKGKFTATYPTYPENGWTVTAKPDGKLKDKSGKEYYSLFWEGITDRSFTLDEGAVVNRENTAEFLEKSLRILGLNYKEANEFIIFWLPELEKNPYNLIHFSTKEYVELAKLTVTPAPDTVIRVFMVFQGLDKPVEIKEQKLVPKHRKGYTVVEWGGSEVKSGSKTAVK